MDTFQNFLISGCLGEVRIGQPIAEAFAILGESEADGRGLRPWKLEGYSGLCLQIAHAHGIVGLIGIYLHHAKHGPPVLPAALKCTVPFSARTTPEELEIYLNCNAIRYEPDTRLPDVVAFKIGAGVIATFDDGRQLDSLLFSGPKL